jgi:ribA/ribD-fused uncharacterized protein
MKRIGDLTLFSGADDPLSNWYPCTFTVKGYTFATNEHLMMFAKARLFGDTEAAAAVLGDDAAAARLLSGSRAAHLARRPASDPARAKALGRAVRNFDAVRWSESAVRIVTAGARAKFTQNPALLQVLLDTEGTHLVEASPYDKIWGVGLAASDPRILDRSAWRGRNLLGNLLTALRDVLLATTPVQRYGCRAEERVRPERSGAMAEIVVVNKANKGRNGAEYIGRGGRGVAASPLANPRRLGDPKPGGGVWQRGETVDLYRHDLRKALDRSQPKAEWWDGAHCMRPLTMAERAAMRAEMNRLYSLALRGRLELDCFCAPERCHGDVIADLLREHLPPCPEGLATVESRGVQTGGMTACCAREDTAVAKAREAAARDGEAYGVYRLPGQWVAAPLAMALHPAERLVHEILPASFSGGGVSGLDDVAADTGTTAQLPPA